MGELTKRVIVITLKDGDSGKVDMSIDFDPPILDKDEPMHGAASLAVRFLEMATKGAK